MTGAGLGSAGCGWGSAGRGFGIKRPLALGGARGTKTGGKAYGGVVTLSQTERNLPTTANVDARNFKDLACWLIVQIGPISLNVTTPLEAMDATEVRLK